MPNLQNIIEELIARKKEGEYYDFKREHHKNIVDLILDITCLANTIRYNGERYLILGVDDDGSLIGLAGTTPRRTQADIIDALRGANFAAGNFPDIRLETLIIDSKEIDVILVEDSPDKPYYLGQDKSYQGKTMRAGVTYARTQDTNTPINSTADPLDITIMWRQRFGLNDTPLHRLKRYLADADNWERADDDIDYYSPFPEFTIRYGETKQLSDILDYDQEYVRGEIGYHYGETRGNAYYATLYFHQTLLAKIHIVNFDNYKKMIAAPDWIALGKGRFYYYLQDSLRYIYQMHLSNSNNKRNDSVNINAAHGHRINTFNIPVLRNKEELDNFMEYYRNKNEKNSGNILEVEENKNRQNYLYYDLLELYDEFKREYRN